MISRVEVEVDGVPDRGGEAVGGEDETTPADVYVVCGGLYAGADAGEGGGGGDVCYGLVGGGGGERRCYAFVSCGVVGVHLVWERGGGEEEEEEEGKGGKRGTVDHCFAFWVDGVYTCGDRKEGGERERLNPARKCVGAWRR